MRPRPGARTTLAQSSSGALAGGGVAAVIVLVLRAGGGEPAPDRATSASAGAARSRSSHTGSRPARSRCSGVAIPRRVSSGAPLGRRARQHVVGVVVVEDDPVGRLSAPRTAGRITSASRRRSSGSGVGALAAATAPRMCRTPFRAAVGRGGWRRCTRRSSPPPARRRCVRLLGVVAPDHEPVVREREADGVRRDPVHHGAHRAGEREAGPAVRHVDDAALEQLAHQPLGRARRGRWSGSSSPRRGYGR